MNFINMRMQEEDRISSEKNIVKWPEKILKNGKKKEIRVNKVRNNPSNPIDSIVESKILGLNNSEKLKTE